MNPPNRHSNDTLGIQLPARSPFLDVVTGFVESSVRALGMGREETLKLRLAAEEIFSYIISHVRPVEPVDIRAVNGLYYGRVEFRFSVAALNMGALNITATGQFESDEALAEMGLVIASRTVDRLRITEESRGRICLAVEKEKTYPPLPDVAHPPAPFREGLTIQRTPDAETLKQYAGEVARGQADSPGPAFFDYPGKVVDMVAAGDNQVIAAVDGAGRVAGGILFRFLTERIVEIVGPHVFDPLREREIAGALLDAAIAAVARTRAIGLVSLTGLPEPVRSQFEPLGSLTFFRDKGPALARPAWYRFLHEDPGCPVWTNGALKDFLEREYGRLFLARDIREVRDLGETKKGSSIFSAEIRRERSEVVLRPLWPGDDLAANVERHIRFLREEGFLNLLFEIDLGVSWQAPLVPVLLGRRFSPGMIIPFAGQADLVVFQYHETRP